MEDFSSISHLSHNRNSTDWLSILRRNNALTADNIRRCLAQHPSETERAALLAELSRLDGKGRGRGRGGGQPRPAVAASSPAEQPPEPPEPPERHSFFVAHLPTKPYCADDLSAGLQIRPIKTALGRAYIQHNGPGMTWTLAQDVDRDIADMAHAKDWTLGPEPDAIVVNPANGHGHLLWYLAAGVCTTSAARLKPMQYLAAIEDGLRRVVGGDVGYAGLITKNPCSQRWRVIERHSRLWTLGDLAAGLDLSAANARTFNPEPGEAHGTGRNVALFNEARFWAYSAIREFWAPAGLDCWQKAVLEHVEALNKQFRNPLPYSEVRSISKSIAGWTWKRMTPQGLRDLIERTHTPEQQRARGRKATNQAQIAPLGGKASGEARRLSREQERATARLLRAQGMTHRAIADALGVPRQTVTDWLTEFGR
jgi:hypothetical protein